MIALSTVVALYALASRLVQASEPVLRWMMSALEEPEARAVLAATQGQEGYSAVDQIRLALGEVDVPPRIQRAVLGVVMYATEILGLVEGSMAHEALLLHRDNVMDVDESGDAEFASYIQAKQLADWSEDTRRELQERYDGNLTACLVMLAEGRPLPLTDEEMNKVRTMCLLAGLSEEAVEADHLASIAWLTMLQSSENLRDLEWYHNRAIPALVATGAVDVMAETMGRVFVPRHDDFNFPVEGAGEFDGVGDFTGAADLLAHLFGLDDDEDVDDEGGIAA